MKLITSTLAVICFLSVASVAQETNAPEQRGMRQGPAPRMEQVERGFGQRQGPRGPMMGQGRQFRGGFRGEGTIQRGCPLCEKHKKMVSKKHFGNRGGKHQKGQPRCR